MKGVPGFFGSAAIVAAKEFRDCARGRWLAAGSCLMAVLSLAIVFGSAAAGGSLAFRSLAETVNSLTGLTVFALPLLAVLISYEAFVGEAEAGTLILMLTYPISRTGLLAGKLLGQGAAILAALVIGQLPLVILATAGILPYGAADLAPSLSVMLGSAWLLGLVAILVSYAVSITCQTRARALAVLLLIWFIVVLLYDLALLVLAVTAPDAMGKGALTALLAANPASAFRLLNQELLGITDQGVPPAALALVPAAWIIVLAALDAALLRRKAL